MIPIAANPALVTLSAVRGFSPVSRQASLVATCQTSDIKPFDYSADTHYAILDGFPKFRIKNPMPWR